MVKLDVSLLRYLNKNDFRVLTSIEMGMRSHELVPRSLVYSISGIQDGSVSKILVNLTQNKLLSYERGKRYDGYRLTYRGYDYLALNVLRNRGAISSIGNQIGVGKESDVYVASNEEGRKVAIKFHRLGRTCFRRVSEKRDYQKKNQNHKTVSWIYLSRLAAMREFAFMKLLHEQNLLPVPEPIDMNRHCIVMELIDGVILNRIYSDKLKEKNVANLYDKLMALMMKLTNEFGVVHGDFNEFNIMIKLDGSYDPILIDFPQMISINHELAKDYFDRDVNCIVDFFARRFHYESETIPIFEPFNLQEIQATDLQNLATALESEGILKYPEKREIKNEIDSNSSCQFTNGKSELLSRFLDSLPQDQGSILQKDTEDDLYYNKNNQELVEQQTEEIKMLDKCLYEVRLSYIEEQLDKGDTIRNQNLCSLKQTTSTTKNITEDKEQKFDREILNDCSDVYSTASTFSPREIKSRLMRENRKREIKRTKINPKNVKGDANAIRRRKKDNQKVANEDMKAYMDDKGF